MAKAHCHEIVKETAIALTHEAYAAFMENDQHYRLWKGLNEGLEGKALEEKWCRKHWGLFVEGARAVLAKLLALPGEDGLKETIYEALLLDNSLVRGRKPVPMQGVPNVRN